MKIATSFITSKKFQAKKTLGKQTKRFNSNSKTNINV
jgi:hypothetical protein